MKNLIKVFLLITISLVIVSCNNKPQKEEVRKKVGQLFLLAFSGNDINVVLPLIKERGIGGLYLSNDNLGEPEATAVLLNSLQKAALEGISKTPLLTAADQEGAWGVMVPYSSTGPGNMALGASDPINTRKMYSVFSKELSAVGVFCNLSPVADVNSNALNPIIGTRSFGENASDVSDRVKAAIEGLHENGTIATAKHFPGHGNTATDSHSGIPKVSRSLKEIESVDLLPFKTAVESGADIVMTAHIIYDAIDKENPATLSPIILNNYLREKLGFNGVIITDSFNMQAIQKNYDPAEAAILAILAGADMIMLAEERYGEDVGDYIKSQNRMLDVVEQAVIDGRIPMSRIDEAYNRLLSLKKRYKLAEKLPVDPIKAKEIIGNVENKQIALSCAEAAMTVAYDNKQSIPLSKDSKVSIVKLAKENVDEIIKIAEGIGPNYANAYSDFVIEMKAENFDVKEYNFDDKEIPSENIIIAVSENYPLPGKSLDLKEQRRRLSKLQEENVGTTIINVALKDPYDANLVKPDAYICAIGSNISNVKAVVNLLTGKIEAKGKFPVTPIN
ncbi:glycoside hydrolase family 3 protein [Flavivirga spongiicola]|uniref:Glycoside hydrolase family 3 N-terminal domain-containing protein n=1 Tax=Flavivirga spongiicola TaxID=421621 RepID=A0ABU7XZG9_9FLAO|nr:glycoside hydrolase family 3 N-terminal domain-containing protein [Flavivirga sp. MEBiC05379]MDO5980810.1 glycoside hydrolase family 3 N-terminal domain-containing protein [Flavivirga sp. MEBiC05379]